MNVSPLISGLACTPVEERKVGGGGGGGGGMVITETSHSYNHCASLLPLGRKSFQIH